MIKKIINTILYSICLFGLTGCGAKLSSYNPMNENEIITFTKNTIYEDLSDEVEVKIKNKTQKYICNSIIDNSCFGKRKIPKTYTYNLLITSKTNSEISIDGNYFTDSYKKDNEIINRKLDYKNYNEKYAKVKFETDINNILSGLKYKMQGNQVFIYSKDYDYLNDKLFSYLLNIEYIYYEKRPILSYDIYIIKDENLFNYLTTSTFDYKGVSGIADNIKNTYGYARNYMEVEKDDSYKYVFFKYSSNGCTGCTNGCSCSVIYGINQIQ